MNKLSVALFSLLLSLAVYAGGTSSLILSMGATGGGGGSGVTLTNRTIGTNTGNQAAISFDNNFSASCGGACGGMLEYIQDGVGTYVAVNDEFLFNWQSGGFPSCVGSGYEIRWSTVSGTVDNIPFDGALNPFPENMWSYSEWSSMYSLCMAGFDWFFFTLAGPVWSQNGASANATIQIDIREIANHANTDSAQFTFNP